MKASELIETIRQFHDDEICVRLGFNLYEIGKISYSFDNSDTENGNKILFFDVETVSQYKNLSDLPVADRKYWDFYYETFKERVTNKSKLPNVEDETYKEEVYRQTASLFPEFGKVCCISVAFVTKDGKTKIDSFYGENEYEILDKARNVFNKVNGLSFNLCGQNIKNSDVPFLGKRYLINGLNPPD